MKLTKREFLAGTIALAASGVRAQVPAFSGKAIRIGVMNDRSGPYTDFSGEGSVVAARMAAEEFGYKVRGLPVEIVTADHQNKVDVGVSIARKWFDADGVDVIVDICNSGVSLAINGLLKTNQKLVMHSSSTDALAGKSCNARSVQWQFSAYASASKVVTPEMIKGGLNSFFVIAVDYALGESLTSIFTNSVKDMGGKILGIARHPLNTSDMSSYLLQAQATGAKGIMLANAGPDLITTVCQAREYGLVPGVQLFAGALMTVDIEAAGLDAMEGVQLLAPFDMYRNEVAKTWLKKFIKRRGHTASSVQVATYSFVRTYLKAIDATGTNDPDTIVSWLQQQTINDAYASNGKVRDDGLMSHDMYLAQVKSTTDSTGPGDYFKIMKVVPGEAANLPLEQSVCPLVKK